MYVFIADYESGSRTVKLIGTITVSSASSDVGQDNEASLVQD